MHVSTMHSAVDTELASTIRMLVHVGLMALDHDVTHVMVIGSVCGIN